MSNLDLVPTLYNLFGIPFDSRLFMGRDVFSNTTPLVFFNDRSWMSDLGYYDVGNNKVDYFLDTHYTEQEIERLNKIVEDKVLASRLILGSDYYRHVLNDEIFGYILEKYRLSN